MYTEGITFDKPYKKSARVVGDVMGKYHPHGDSSIYEALIRMSQSWKMGTCLIDVHGNNGSIDGDSPAAMRYTETRLSKISNEILKDLNKNTVLMTWNYDDNLKEPTVLPCKFPNLLVNGATGISAGYATNIPPHNLGEIIDATIKRIDSPNSRLDTIQAAILLPKLEAFEDYELEKRDKFAKMYSEKLADVVKTPFIPEGYFSSWAQYTIKLTDENERNFVQNKLKEKGIPTMIYYPIPLHRQKVYEGYNFNLSDLTVSEYLSKVVLSLPMHPYMNEEQIDLITNSIIDAINEYRK